MTYSVYISVGAGSTPFETVVYGLYPILDVPILGLLIMLMWYYRKGQLEDYWFFITVAASFWMAGDVVYLVEAAADTYVTGSLSDCPVPHQLQLARDRLRTAGLGEIGIHIRRSCECDAAEGLRQGGGTGTTEGVPCLGAEVGQGHGHHGGQPQVGTGGAHHLEEDTRADCRAVRPEEDPDAVAVDRHRVPTTSTRRTSAS